MALSLKDPATDRLARQVAALTGESLTEAIRTALAERLARERYKRGQPADGLARLEAMAAEIAAMPDLDTRTLEEIIGYDEHGIWS